MKKRKKKRSKIVPILLIVLIFLTLAFTLNFSPKETVWGVTFSQYYAQDELGLDWKETYTAILDDLKADHLRLSAYWKYLESDKGTYFFNDLDWQIQEAGKRDVKIILGVGRKLPRWPECHDPSWLEGLGEKEIQTKQLEFVQKTVERYRDNDSIIAWQVENEPYLQLFGECPGFNESFFKQEISLVKKLSAKPVLITDSGELNWWFKAASSGGDYVGTTLYRTVYNKYIGYLKYFWPPSFYYAKSFMVKSVFHTKRVIVAELQAEAWHIEGKSLPQMSLAEQLKSMDEKQLRKNVSFTERAGFDEAYLWGAEWWYYLKVKKDYPGLWNEAKTLWSR
ncbi:MAG: hypothetical protein AAB791_03675 [Patescibacteria group bacterium]